MLMELMRMMERQQAANWLAIQGVLRVSGLANLAMLSSLDKMLETYLIGLQHGAGLLTEAEISADPQRFIAGYADTMIECVEKSWQDFRNHLQILLLTQQEGLVWLGRIDQALLPE